MTERLEAKRYVTLRENEPFGSPRENDHRRRGCEEHPEGWLVTYTAHQAVVAELEARLEKAEKDKAFYMNAAAEETDRHAKALDQLQQATEREAALRGYAQHKSTCRNWAEIGVCTCGLKALAHNPKG